MISLIVQVEQSKNKLIGYEYQSEGSFSVDICIDFIKKFLLENMSSYAKQELDLENNIVEILEQINYDYKDEHDLKVELDLIAVHEHKANYKWKKCPSNYRTYVTKNNLTYEEAVSSINKSLEKPPIITKASIKKLNELGINIWEGTVLLFENEDDASRYDVYEIAKAIKYTGISKVLKSKYSISDSKIKTSYLYFKDLNIGEDLKGEAAVIYSLLRDGLQIPMLKHFESEDQYLQLIKTHKCSIKELNKLLS